jgi:hypothetical protein
LAVLGLRRGLHGVDYRLFKEGRHFGGHTLGEEGAFDGEGEGRKQFAASWELYGIPRQIL